MESGVPPVLTEKVKACVISYLNTVPLIWGMLHGDQRGQFELAFGVPARTAEILKAGAADIGIVSSIELPRQNLRSVPGLGIASRGAVRSIFLITKKSASEIRTLAADASSRTSVALCRILLKHRFQTEPVALSAPPDLEGMLDLADAALIIGDPALRLDLKSTQHTVYDLGQEWTEMTGLPMVYAVWAVRDQAIADSLCPALLDSYYYGRDHMDELVKIEASRRGFPEALTKQYLTEHLAYELGTSEQRGLELFLQYAENLDLV